MVLSLVESILTSTKIRESCINYFLKVFKYMEKGLKVG